MNLLEVRGLSVDFNGVNALRDVSINVPEKAVVTVIGANGAGKSTLLRAIAGVVKPSSGRIVYGGESIDSLKTHQRLERGIVLSPEGRKLFPEMTVYENLRMGAYRVRDAGKFRRRQDHVYRIFPRVAERANQVAGTLSGGEQQMVAIARALMSDPKILMLDEPTLGLAPQLVMEVAKLVKTINSEGVTVILVEQNAKLALRISDYAFVLETGSIALEDASETLLNSDSVQALYLGGS